MSIHLHCIWVVAGVLETPNPKLCVARPHILSPLADNNIILAIYSLEQEFCYKCDHKLHPV